MDPQTQARAGRGRRRWARLSGGWLLGVAVCLMVLAWVGGNPPGMSVDEPAHYRKAVGLAHLDVMGERAAYLRAPDNSPSKLAWINRTSRAVRVPPKLHGCDPFRLPLGGRCPWDPTTVLDRRLPVGTELTYVGTYPPYVYVLPSSAMRLVEALGGETEAVLITGRAAVAVLCLALVIAAGFLLRGPQNRGPQNRGPQHTLTGLLGLTLALSPMVLFLAGELAASGPEVAASICVLAAGLCLTRLANGRSPTTCWVALAAGGLVLSISRSLGPLWLLALLALVVVLRGPRPVLALARAHRRAAAATTAVVGSGIVATALWTIIVEPHAEVRPSTVIGGVGPGLRQLPEVARHAVGSFGWFDVDLPWPLYALWGVLVVGMVALALVVGSRRERTAVVALAALEVVGAVVVYAAVIRPTSPDFRMQGRYVLPLLVALPLVAGEVVHGNVGRVASLLRGRASVLLGGAMAAAVAVHGVAWAVNARHYVVDAKFNEEYPAGWEPIGGWAVWAVLVAAAVVVGWLGLASARGAGRGVAIGRLDE